MRALLAGDFNAGVALPYQLDFNRPKGGLLDRDGTGTGFTWALPNGAGTEFNTKQLDLKIGVGILRLYSQGTAWEANNTQVNALTTRFAASSRAWVVGARVNGPIPQIDQVGEEGGIIIGPDQDNWVKLVVTSAGNGNVGIKFQDEQRFKVGFRHQLSGTIHNIGKGSAVQTLDLWFSGDPDTGILRALYRVNSGPIVELSEQLLPRKREVFFANSGFAGVFASHDKVGGIDFTLDQFGMKRGVLTGDTGGGGGAGNLTIGSKKLFNDVRGGGGQTVGTSVKNTGSGSIKILSLSVTGTDAGQFSATATKTLPITLAPGESLPLKITFSAPSGTALNIKTATLTINAEGKTKTVSLRGLATSGTGGTNEPSLQRLLDLYQIPVNVGDANPDDVYLGDPPGASDEVLRQRFVKAGSGPVIVQPLGVFGVSANPSLRFGWYGAGSQNDRTELFTVGSADSQTVNPVPDGTTSFDPGSADFGFYSVWPAFANTDGSVRTVFQEDTFNTTFDTHLTRHVRFYPLKNADGSVVANAYVMAHEEFNGGYDFQDIAAIVYNVKDATADAEIGTENLDGYPAPDRMVFNRFRSADPNFPTTAFHDTAKMRVRNTGTADLNISSIGITGPFSILSATGAQSVAPGKFTDVTVKFTGDSTTGVRTGALTINSNDSDEPAKVIGLAGFNQLKPEGTNEAPLAVMMNQIFGYTTSFQNAGQQLTNGGKVEAVGDEVLSPYWFRANNTLPVTVKQLTAFHTQQNTSTLSRYNKGSSTVTKLFASAGIDAQSIFPRKDGDLTQMAAANFTPGSGAFGFRVDGNEWSDDTKNMQEQPGGGFGHHLRFFPLKNSKGQFVGDTYLLVMDFAGINYDYNDNTYLITNIRPENAPAAQMAGQSAQFSGTQIMQADASSTPSADDLLDGPAQDALV